MKYLSRRQHFVILLWILSIWILRLRFLRIHLNPSLYLLFRDLREFPTNLPLCRIMSENSEIFIIPCYIHYVGSCQIIQRYLSYHVIFNPLALKQCWKFVQHLQNNLLLSSESRSSIRLYVYQSVCLSVREQIEIYQNRYIQCCSNFQRMIL